MKNSTQKGIALPIIILIIAVVVGGGVYAVTKNNTTVIPNYPPEDRNESGELTEKKTLELAQASLKVQLTGLNLDCVDFDGIREGGVVTYSVGFKPAQGCTNDVFKEPATVVVNLTSGTSTVTVGRPVQTNQSNSSATNWKTYTNPTLGIEFVYPTYLGDVVIQKTDAKVCPEMKLYSLYGTIEASDYVISFSQKQKIGNGGSFMEYRIPIITLENDIKVCGAGYSSLLTYRDELKSDVKYYSAPFTQKNVTDAFKSNIATSIGTSAGRIYSLFNIQRNKIRFAQPQITFVPYYNSAEWSEISHKEQSGDQMAIITFINQSNLAQPIREQLDIFEKIVESFKFTN